MILLKGMAKLEFEASDFDITKARTQLSIILKAVYEGRLSLERAYEKGLAVRKELEEKSPRARSYKKNCQLLDAFNFLDQLHDSRTREYFVKHREEVYHQMRVISG